MTRAIVAGLLALALPVAVVLYVLLRPGRTPRVWRVVPAWVEW
jgi:hypothetical protein